MRHRQRRTSGTPRASLRRCPKAAPNKRESPWFGLFDPDGYKIELIERK